MARKTRVFSATDYNQSRQDYAKGWQAIDETLYRLCRDHPTHNDPAGVNAKIFIIGRTYATGIERKVPTTGAQGSSISQVANFFFTHGKQIDGWLVQLANVSEPLSISNVAEILTIHGLISQKLKQITINKQSARAFVSKYLHFHNSAVPIYDSIATGVLRGLVPLKQIRSFQIPAVKPVDSEYADYVRRFLNLYQSAVSQNLAVSVRSLDTYLMWMA